MSADTRPRVRDLRERLLALHKLLLDDEHRAYEAIHGRVASSGELLTLVLRHEQFAWLRPLSEMISSMDSALDEPDPVDLDRLVLETRALLRSDRDGPFETRYREALQRSPDVVMAHASVVALL